MAHRLFSKGVKGLLSTTNKFDRRYQAPNHSCCVSPALQAFGVGSSRKACLKPVAVSRRSLSLPLHHHLLNTCQSKNSTYNMSGGNDWGAPVRAQSEMYASCMPVPLTTSFAAPSSCGQYRTPYVTARTIISVSEVRDAIPFIRSITLHERRPSQFLPFCDSCPGVGQLFNISLGVCPSSSTAASTGIVNGVTTHYCCPT